jgi:large conductance mechanosensitive channel
MLRCRRLPPPRAAGVATLNIGLFINAVVKFTIIAFVLFMVVKAINSLKREAAKGPVAETPAPTKEEVLLTEIRDALRANPR